MSEAPKEEDVKFFVKIAWYIFGIMLGLGAKLVVVNKEKPLTMKEFVYHSCIAFASAWLVWWALDYSGHTDWAMMCAVIVGRFGDIILIAAYNKLLDFFKDIKPRKNQQP